RVYERLCQTNSAWMYAYSIPSYHHDTTLVLFRTSAYDAFHERFVCNARICSTQDRGTDDCAIGSCFHEARQRVGVHAPIDADRQRGRMCVAECTDTLDDTLIEWLPLGANRRDAHELYVICISDDRFKRLKRRVVPYGESKLEWIGAFQCDDR